MQLQNYSVVLVVNKKMCWFFFIEASVSVEIASLVYIVDRICCLIDIEIFQFQNCGICVVCICVFTIRRFVRCFFQAVFEFLNESTFRYTPMPCHLCVCVCLLTAKWYSNTRKHTKKIKTTIPRHIVKWFGVYFYKHFSCQDICQIERTIERHVVMHVECL